MLWFLARNATDSEQEIQTPLCESHNVRVRREGAPNRSRGGCAPNPFFGQAIRASILHPPSAIFAA